MLLQTKLCRNRSSRRCSWRSTKSAVTSTDLTNWADTTFTTCCSGIWERIQQSCAIKTKKYADWRLTGDKFRAETQSRIFPSGLPARKESSSSSKLSKRQDSYLITIPQKTCASSSVAIANWLRCKVSNGRKSLKKRSARSSKLVATPWKVLATVISNCAPTTTFWCRKWLYLPTKRWQMGSVLRCAAASPCSQSLTGNEDEPFSFLPPHAIRETYKTSNPN